MEKIVVVGAGFGGVHTVLGLAKEYKGNKDVTVTLIDKNDYHLFTSNLFEIAAAEEEFATMDELKKSIAIPCSQILSGSGVIFIQGMVSSIDQMKKRVVLEKQEIPYTRLVLALGSQSDYFGIPGAEQFSLPLKTLEDGLRIKNQIEFAIQLHRQDAAKKNIRIVIAGGGYTGLEFAAELARTIHIIAWKNSYPTEKIELEIIEGMGQLVPGFDDRLSKDSYARIKDLGIHVRLSSIIAKVDEHFVELQNGEKIYHDVLVWSAGVRAKTITFSKPIELDKKGRIAVNEFLQSKDDTSIFVLGDQALIMGEGGRPVPGTAQDAWHEGRYLGGALSLLIKNQKPKAYSNHKHGFIITLGGKWAIVDYNGLYVKGFIGYIIGQFAHLRYFRSVIGLWKAIGYVCFEMDVLSRND